MCDLHLFTIHKLTTTYRSLQTDHYRLHENTTYLHTPLLGTTYHHWPLLTIPHLNFPAKGQRAVYVVNWPISINYITISAMSGLEF